MESVDLEVNKNQSIGWWWFPIETTNAQLTEKKKLHSVAIEDMQNHSSSLII